MRISIHKEYVDYINELKLIGYRQIKNQRFVRNPEILTFDNSRDIDPNILI
jgi:hypothetical protein